MPILSNSAAAALTPALIFVKRLLNASESSFNAAAYSFKVFSCSGAASINALTAESIFGVTVAII